MEEAWIKADEEMRPIGENESNPSKARIIAHGKAHLRANGGQLTWVLVDILMRQKLSKRLVTRRIRSSNEEVVIFSKWQRLINMSFEDSKSND